MVRAGETVADLTEQFIDGLQAHQGGLAGEQDSQGGCQGFFDDVAAWDRALSLEEIQEPFDPVPME